MARVPDVLQAIRRAQRVSIPFPVIGELRFGFLRGSKASANQRILDQFVRQPNVGIAYADDATTHQYAILRDQLARAGKPIPTNDLWIAALCIQHGLVLYTRDMHFDVIPQLARL